MRFHQLTEGIVTIAAALKFGVGGQAGHMLPQQPAQWVQLPLLDQAVAVTPFDFPVGGIALEVEQRLPVEGQAMDMAGAIGQPVQFAQPREFAGDPIAQRVIAMRRGILELDGAVPVQGLRFRHRQAGGIAGNGNRTVFRRWFGIRMVFGQGVDFGRQQLTVGVESIALPHARAILGRIDALLDQPPGGIVSISGGPGVADIAIAPLDQLTGGVVAIVLGPAIDADFFDQAIHHVIAEARRRLILVDQGQQAAGDIVFQRQGQTAGAMRDDPPLRVAVEADQIAVRLTGFDQATGGIIAVGFATAIGPHQRRELPQGIPFVAGDTAHGIGAIEQMSPHIVAITGGPAGAVGIGQQLAGIRPLQFFHTTFGIDGFERPIAAHQGIGRVRVAVTGNAAIRCGHREQPAISIVFKARGQAGRTAYLEQLIVGLIPGIHGLTAVRSLLADHPALAIEPPVGGPAQGVDLPDQAAGAIVLIGHCATVGPSMRDQPFQPGFAFEAIAFPSSQAVGDNHAALRIAIVEAVANPMLIVLLDHPRAGRIVLIEIAVLRAAAFTVHDQTMVVIGELSHPDAVTVGHADQIAGAIVLVAHQRYRPAPGIARRFDQIDADQPPAAVGRPAPQFRPPIVHVLVRQAITPAGAIDQSGQTQIPVTQISLPPSQRVEKMNQLETAIVGLAEYPDSAAGTGQEQVAGIAEPLTGNRRPTGVVLAGGEDRGAAVQ